MTFICLSLPFASLSVLVLSTEVRLLGDGNISKSTSRFDVFIMTAIGKGPAWSPLISRWTKAYLLLPYVMLVWGLGGEGKICHQQIEKDMREGAMEVGRETPSGYPELKVSNLRQR